ncbi:MAG: ABC transporter ATP-binding protein [Candidatus Micrarchaeia archaeon]
MEKKQAKKEVRAHAQAHPSKGRGEVVMVLDKIRKTYHMGESSLDALKDVSFEVHKGEWISIIGPSGSGKSTLLQILGLLDYPTSGQLSIDGVPTLQMSDAQRATFRGKKVGFIFQSFHLIPTLTALENVMLPMMFYDIPFEARRERATKVLSSLSMGDRLEHLPSELSGGQRQRVAIARALVNEPTILLADEPTGNLDSKSGAAVMDIFSLIHSEGKTLIIVTHDPNVASLAQRIVHIKDGMVEKIAEGSRK